jgi:hypothetical protein
MASDSAEMQIAMIARIVVPVVSCPAAEVSIDQILNRNDKPLATRIRPRPRVFTVTRLTRFETLTPVLERFTRPSRPRLFDFRNIRPMALPSLILTIALAANTRLPICRPNSATGTKKSHRGQRRMGAISLSSSSTDVQTTPMRESPIP